MAEHQAQQTADQEEEGVTPGYRAPDVKPLSDILTGDKDDESLERYKKQLLGDNPLAVEPVFPDDSRRVIVQKLALCVEGRDDLEMDLTQDKDKIKQEVFIIKEACKYRLKIYFYVQREIVSGLHYVQKTSRKGIPIDRTNVMVGSYGPKAEINEWVGALEDAPSGALAKGSYTISSKFVDDDSNIYLEWSWTLKIKSDWTKGGDDE